MHKQDACMDKKNLIEAVRPVMKVSRPMMYHKKTWSEFKKPENLSKAAMKVALKTTLNSETGYSISQAVSHKKFGKGVIVDYEGAGESLRLQVKFEHAGTKWLVASFAKLEK